eukprot:gb/GEZN01016678.1/.p1 GENE.gb/GEZN01016678.1/~~gb/GEZN01016678.1/.p1  ORF type:complete len:136 (-),score=27.75 gb/GEZN01016678.1/:406-813(-)
MALSLFSPFAGTLDNLWHRNLDWDVLLNEPVDVGLTEHENQYTMRVRTGEDFGKNKLDVTVEDDVCTIKGEYSDEQKSATGFHRRFSSFSRSVRLPDNVDQDKIKAEFKGGVLNVTLPKKAEILPPKKAKSITIE